MPCMPFTGMMEVHLRPPNVVSARVCILVIFIFAMERYPIAAKIAGSIGILQYCVLNDFFI